MSLYTAISLERLKDIAICRANKLASHRGMLPILKEENILHYSNSKERLSIIISEEHLSKKEIKEILSQGDEILLFAIHPDQNLPHKGYSHRVFRFPEIASEPQEVEITTSSRKELPKIYISDVVSKWYGLREGDVIRHEGMMRIVVK